MSDRFLREENENYCGESSEQVEERLLGYHDSIYGGGICEIDSAGEDLWRAVHGDPAALTYLAKVQAERAGEKAKTIARDGLEKVREAAREALLSSGGRVPVEVHDRFARRFGSASRSEKEILVLEDY